MSGRTSEEEISYNKMIFSEMPLATLLGIKADNIITGLTNQDDSDQSP